MLHNSYPNDLSIAIEEKDIDKVAKVLNQGADIDSKHQIYLGLFSPNLNLAVQRGSVEIAELLIMRGAAIDNKCSHGETALHTAADKSPAFTKLLLEQKATPNILSRGWSKNTPLKAALDEANVETVKLLLQHKANPKIADLYGKDAPTYFKEYCIPSLRARVNGPQIIAQLEALLEGAIVEQEQSAADEKTSGLRLR